MASPQQTLHIVIFPFMAQGHTIPLLDLSKVLSRQQVRITIITTPSNAKAIAPTIDGFRHISLVQLPFQPSIDGLPEGCENTSQLPSMDFFYPFAMATKQLQMPFEQVLQSMKNLDDLPVCVISDFFLGWTVGICQRFGVLRLVFHGMGVLPMVISKILWANKLQSKSSPDSDHLNLLGKLPFSLTIADHPEEFKITYKGELFIELLSEVGESEMQSWGVIVNSFLELESKYVSAFESFYTNGAKAWCLGPIFLNEEMEVSDEKMGNGGDEHSAKVMKWLDMHATERSESVIYASFGTQADISDAQLEEVALGLEDSGCAFLLVIRSDTWSPPNGMEERVKTRGLITREFVDQRRILFHSATGGFLSHCGWNSVLESMAASVPILAWPMMAEQKLNAKYAVDGLGFGVDIEKENTVGPGIAVSRLKIGAGVKELMQGEKGRSARERAAELGRLARRAVEDGGSSNETLKDLLRKLRALSNSSGSV